MPTQSRTPRALSFFYALALSLAALAGCGSAVGSGDGGTEDAAAADAGPGAGMFAGRFAGTASIGDGTFEVNSTFTNGARADIQVTATGVRTGVSSEPLSCTWTASRAGEMATVLTGGSCTVGSGRLVVASGTMTIAGDALTASLDGQLEGGTSAVEITFTLRRVR